MKKISLILVIVVCLNLCACTSGKISSAVKEADQLVAKWHMEGAYACSYRTEFVSEHNGYEVAMYIVYARYSSEVDRSDYPEAVKNLIRSELVKEAYPQLKAIFGDLDVDIGIIISDSTGTDVHSTIVNGKLVDN